jgi:hypothetical protein
MRHGDIWRTLSLNSVICYEQGISLTSTNPSELANKTYKNNKTPWPPDCQPLAFDQTKEPQEGPPLITVQFSFRLLSAIPSHINRISKYTNSQQMHFNIYDAFYSQCSHQHVSTSIPGVFRVTLLQEYKNVQMWLTVSVIVKPTWRTFFFNLLRIKGLYMFRALLAHP